MKLFKDIEEELTNSILELIEEMLLLNYDLQSI